MSNPIVHLKKLVFDGARKKNIVLNEETIDRIYYELSVIDKKGFADYFICYSRIIEICNELNLLRSCGRSTAISSMVNYCLDITKIDPLKENLVFEKFIHLKNKNLPDIDIDIPKNQQKKLVERLTKKYPEFHTYFIAINCTRPNFEAYEDVQYNGADYKKHPSGVIITTEPISHSVFQYNGHNFYFAENISTDPYYDIKFDLVELEYLDRLQSIVNIIGEKYHPYLLPINDKKALDLFSFGDLENIFQFESPEMKNYLIDFKPSSINDLTVMFAMFRPWLKNRIPELIRNKTYPFKNYKPWSDERVTEILGETYGLLIYQETILQLAKNIAGLDFAVAEVWRRKIMRDKTNTYLNRFIEVFNNGCQNHSTLSPDEIIALTNHIKACFPVSFQKSHSLSHATISYWGAYYKTYFPQAFKKAFLL